MVLELGLYFFDVVDHLCVQRLAQLLVIAFHEREKDVEEWYRLDEVLCSQQHQTPAKGLERQTGSK